MTTQKQLRCTVSAISLSSALLLGVAAPVAAQQPPATTPDVQTETPLAGLAPGQDERTYPSGDRLQAEYQTFAGGIPLQTPRLATPADPAAMEATVGFSAGLEIQPSLPPGFTLGKGDTSRVMEELPTPAAQPRNARARSGSAQFGETTAAGPASPDSLEMPAKYITLYAVDYQGIPLAKGSDVLSIVREDGLLLATRKRGLPTAVDATEATVSPQEAIEAVQGREDQELTADQSQISQPRLEIWVDDQMSGRLAWTFTVESPSLEDPESWQYWVAAVGEPEIIHSENLIYHNHFGTVSGTLWETSPLQGTSNRTLRRHEVSRTGASAGKATTNEEGRYAFTTGTGNATIVGNLSGPNTVVQNQSGSTMQVSKAGAPGNPIDLNFGASDELEIAQVTAFYWTNFAQHMAREILNPADLPALPTRVNINSFCNAFWNGSSINFFKSGGPCPNTAYSDVVLHEYGHGVDHRKGGIIDGGYSEGFGDAMAVLGTKQPCLGRDFRGSGDCLRLATEVITWPPAPGDGVHAIGRRYAGFTWELVDQLKHTYSSDGAFDIATRLVMAAALANPSNIPDAVRLSILVDDTDGDLLTCSPHQRELEAAADSRNIPRPPNCTDVVSMAVASSAHFPFTEQKKASSNANILQAQLTLDHEMDVLISANSSAKLNSGGPLTFRTGFLNQPTTNVMWTFSLRDVTVVQANQWENFGSAFAIRLPAGTHTLYWKVWVSGGEVQFSSGGLQVEAFPVGTSAVALAAQLEQTPITTAGLDDRASQLETAATVTTHAPEQSMWDVAGQPVTVTPMDEPNR